MHEEYLTPPLSEFRAQAHRIHAQLLASLRELARAPQTQAFWALESALLAHLRAEEELLLPDFDLAYPSDAAHVRGEHQRIRELLMRVGSGAHGQAPDPGVIEALCACLNECASVEEHALYPWAEQRLRATKKGEFMQRARANAASSELLAS